MQIAEVNMQHTATLHEDAFFGLGGFEPVLQTWELVDDKMPIEWWQRAA